MESFLSTSIYSVFSWPISTFLRFSRIGKPVLDKDMISVVEKYIFWKKKFLTLPTITICLLSPSASFCLYLELCPNFTWNLIGSYVSSGSRDEILEGGILLHPVTLL